MNIPDAAKGSVPSDGGKKPRQAPTRAFQVKADRFDVLVNLEPPSQPPLDEKKQRRWESDRGSRKREAEAVFERA